MINKKDINVLIRDPLPGRSFRWPITYKEKEIGTILFNCWPKESDSKIITGVRKEAKMMCTLEHIEVFEEYKRQGAAYRALVLWLPGFDRVDTRANSWAAMKLIVKAGFRTGNSVDYIWEREKKDD
ncbi:MAG: hypothetical protein GY853_14090 [PVC group bacterium]|nr:hypothetical protein [PVC group bacterium]